MSSDMDALKKLSEGMQLLGSGDLEEAIARFEEVLAFQPGIESLRSAHFARLEALRKLGRHEEASAAEENWESVVQAAMAAWAARAGGRPQPARAPAPEPSDVSYRARAEPGTQRAYGTRYCASCGTENTAGGDFCASCGASLTTVSRVARTSAVRLSLARVLAVTALSFGLYFFYWFYLTWKQLQPETRGVHYPVWHALTLSVPIYNLFRIHRHMTVITQLSLGAGLTPSLSAGGAVILYTVTYGLGFVSLGMDDLVTLILLSVLSVALTTALLVWAQGSLNRYWETVHGQDLQEARIGVGEVIFVLVGLLLGIAAFLPV